MNRSLPRAVAIPLGVAATSLTLALTFASTAQAFEYSWAYSPIFSSTTACNADIARKVAAGYRATGTPAVRPKYRELVRTCYPRFNPVGQLSGYNYLISTGGR